MLRLCVMDVRVDTTVDTHVLFGRLTAGSRERTQTHRSRVIIVQRDIRDNLIVLTRLETMRFRRSIAANFMATSHDIPSPANDDAFRLSFILVHTAAAPSDATFSASANAVTENVFPGLAR